MAAMCVIVWWKKCGKLMGKLYLLRHIANDINFVSQKVRLSSRRNDSIVSKDIANSLLIKKNFWPRNSKGPQHFLS